MTIDRQTSSAPEGQLQPIARSPFIDAGSQRVTIPDQRTTDTQLSSRTAGSDSQADDDSSRYSSLAEQLFKSANDEQDPLRKAGLFVQAAESFVRARKFDEAIQANEKAAETYESLAKKVGENIRDVRDCNVIARCYLLTGDICMRMNETIKAQAAYTKSGDAYMACAFFMPAECCEDKKKIYSDAITQFLKAGACEKQAKACEAMEELLKYEKHARKKTYEYAVHAAKLYNDAGKTRDSATKYMRIVTDEKYSKFIQPGVFSDAADALKADGRSYDALKVCKYAIEKFYNTIIIDNFFEKAEKIYGEADKKPLNQNYNQNCKDRCLKKFGKIQKLKEDQKAKIEAEQEAKLKTQAATGETTTCTDSSIDDSSSYDSSSDDSLSYDSSSDDSLSDDSSSDDSSSDDSSSDEY